jgi:hypothetical protein
MATRMALAVGREGSGLTSAELMARSLTPDSYPNHHFKHAGGSTSASRQTAPGRLPSLCR